MHTLAIILTAGLLAIGAQEKRMNVIPKRGDAVAVKGCIVSGTIESTDTEVRDSSGSYSSFVTYRISGNKKIINPIKKEHDGHADVLIGTLKSDLPETNSPKSTRIGNTRVVIGAGEQSRTNPRAPQSMPVLDVKEIEHTGVNCRT
ncbi:hypothetical protein BH18ACI5_BH18ACI5_27110 [soil metagenome]